MDSGSSGSAASHDDLAPINLADMSKMSSVGLSAKMRLKRQIKALAEAAAVAEAASNLNAAAAAEIGTPTGDAPSGAHGILDRTMCWGCWAPSQW